MTDCNIGAEDAKALCEVLKVNTTLTSLHLYCESEKLETEREKNEWMTDNKIGVEGAKAMSEMLKMNTTMTSLDMRGQETRKEKGKGKWKMNKWQRMGLEMKERRWWLTHGGVVVKVFFSDLWEQVHEMKNTSLREHKKKDGWMTANEIGVKTIVGMRRVVIVKSFGIKNTTEYPKQTEHLVTFTKRHEVFKGKREG